MIITVVDYIVIDCLPIRPSTHPMIKMMFGELSDLASSGDRRSLLAGVFAACLQVSSDG